MTRRMEASAPVGMTTISSTDYPAPCRSVIRSIFDAILPSACSSQLETPSLSRTRPVPRRRGQQMLQRLAVRPEFKLSFRSRRCAAQGTSRPFFPGSERIDNFVRSALINGIRNLSATGGATSSICRTHYGWYGDPLLGLHAVPFRNIVSSVSPDVFNRSP